MQVDLLLSISKQSYETQITFLNAEISRREIVITKLESKIESLESELDEAAELIEDYKSKTGLGQYLDIAKTFLMSKQGNLKPISNLKDSTPETIPAEIIQILGLVDYDAIPADQLTQIIDYLKIFIQKLPLKNQS
jgi:chromosome segregation ATPase